MATIGKQDLLDRVVTGLDLDGWGVVEIQAAHPFELAISKGSQQRHLRVYLWNATHGGGQVRSPDEFRIQITGVTLPIGAPAGVQVLLLGWQEDLGVFAAFDPTLHRSPSESSPSLQIPLSKLELASRGGRLTRHVRGNGEIALAFPPDRLGQYVKYQPYLHKSADEPEVSLDNLDTGPGKEAGPDLVEVRESIADAAGRPAASSGQRHLMSTEARIAVEMRATGQAIAHFEAEHWTVVDVSRSSPYDLDCSKDGRRLHVEVKGTTSQGKRVLLTPNEVDHALSTKAELALFIVSGIVLESADEDVRALGGRVGLHQPWILDVDLLQPVGFEYDVPA